MPILCVSAGVIVIFLRLQPIYTEIVTLQAKFKNLQSEIDALSTKILDIPLPIFEDLSAKIITCKNETTQAIGELRNLEESFYTYQNKTNARITADTKRAKKEVKEKEEYEEDEATIAATQPVVQSASLPVRLLPKSMVR
jgi:chaperonin cofactor prefoldin